MNALFQAMNKTATTENGALAYHTSLSHCLDFFYLAGASRGKDTSHQFKMALLENPDIALRALQHLRDIRGGSGERQLFRELTKVVHDSEANRVVLVDLFKKTPEIGRYDDLLWFVDNLAEPYSGHAVNEFCNGLKSNNGLAFKWCPIKGDTAKKLRKALGFKKEADWRKYIVAGRKTVEQKMCAKEWNEIEFSKVPSVASARYMTAFHRNCGESYQDYKDSLVKGETTINAGAVYPYDVLKASLNGNEIVAEAMWNSLPDYLEGSEENILPMIDVSSSMECTAGGSKSLTCMDVAISLGLYVAQRNNTQFKDCYFTFESQPNMLCANLGTLKNKFLSIKHAPWGGSTNIVLAFERLLHVAKHNGLTQKDMPTSVVIFSDMQMDNRNSGDVSKTTFEHIKDLYEASGFVMPKLIFWNLNASNTSKPVTKHETGTVMVSGYSPSLLKTVFKGANPYEAMLETLMVERYNI